MTGTPILKEVKPVAVRKSSKGLSVKDKNKMCSIMGFLLYMKETGKLDEEEAKKWMEELPLYSTARVQTEFFENEVFDLKKIEVELWKPMVVENKLNKKNEKNAKKNKKEVEKNKKEKNTEEDKADNTEEDKKEVIVKKKGLKKEKVLSSVEDVVSDDKKRGRKAKKQIIVFNNDDDNSNDDNVKADVKPDQLEELLNDMLQVEGEGEVNENDLNEVLRELDMEEFKEEEPQPQPVVAKKVKAKKETKKDVVVVEEEVVVVVKEKEKKPKKDKKDKKVTITTEDV